MKKQMLSILSSYWGYDSFRPYQEEAIASILDARDTLTVLPTGGGKSICFQVPALMSEGMAVIISPLISLMKDQVDYLKEIGVGAECLHSGFDSRRQEEIIQKVQAQQLKLLYIAPERLQDGYLRQVLQSIKLSFFVIDESHCISHWGHDFRADYRNLGAVKKEFGGINIHAFTATATKEVQKDIITQLALEQPHVYIGSIDRPNLTYRVLPRSGNALGYIVSVLKKHVGQPGIVYCLRRADVDEISQKLNELGYINLPYHAGLSDDTRKKNQEAFSVEKVNIIVATIAFGMGIDRSNIRFVIHAAMPKSLEHYQQETGRAGRDGLPAYCYMFYSGADYRTWEYLSARSSHKETLLEKLRDLYNFCVKPACRHKYLSEYFGQISEAESCRACDYCLQEFDMVEGAGIVARSIVQCIAATGERFGAEHIGAILRGITTESVERWGHDALPDFGTMHDASAAYVRSIIEQLLGQGFLEREPVYKSLLITQTGRRLAAGEIVPVLAKPLTAVKKKETDKKILARQKKERQGMDAGLFEALRAKRTELAQRKNIPAYVIFSDKSLLAMAGSKPKTSEEFRMVFGVGDAKLAQYGGVFMEVINAYQRAHQDRD